jgi:hypothetical protein
MILRFGEVLDNLITLGEEGNVLEKIKRNLKNKFYNLCFLFRPMITVLFVFFLFLLSSIILILSILYLDENTQLYQIFLAILTGTTASFLIAIIMELFNNYHYNCKRQRELRGYFSFVSGYEIGQYSFLKTKEKYNKKFSQENIRKYAVFSKLEDIIPELREALNHRDYLYPKELENIDDILYKYKDILNFIYVSLSPLFADLVSLMLNEANQEIDDAEFNLFQKNKELFNFLKKKAKYYAENNDEVNFDGEDQDYLRTSVEKAVFYHSYLFNDYFEMLDKNYSPGGITDDKEELGGSNNLALFNMIGDCCKEIDEKMVKLQKRVAKEPYFWTLADYEVDSPD